MKEEQKELKPELYKIKILMSETYHEDFKRAMKECDMTIQEMQLLAIWVQIKKDNCDLMEFLTEESQNAVKDDTRKLFVEESYQNRDQETRIN